MSDPARILVIDDDEELCELLAELLGQDGYAVETAGTGAIGLERLSRARSEPISLVVLDVMLPGMNGFEVLQRLRKTSRVPVLMLTARGEDVDRIVGLEMGADDYLPKPFNPRELVARVRAIHRRMATAPPASTDSGAGMIVVDDVELSPSARRARVRGEEIKLTTAEFDLLEVLVKHAGTVVSREDLCKLVLGRSLSAYDRAIDMHVSNLRKKVGRTPSGDERIKTVRNTGYILVKEAP